MERWERTHRFTARQLPLHVNAARAKGVIEVATSDGRLSLWVASAANGHVCWFVGFRGNVAFAVLSTVKHFCGH